MFFIFTSQELFMNYTSLPRISRILNKAFNYPCYLSFLKWILGAKCCLYSFIGIIEFILNFQIYTVDTKGVINNTLIFSKVIYMYTKTLLWDIRTNLPMLHVLDNLEHLLHIPFKESEGFIRFLCFNCNEMQATINPKNNLSHCFACDKNLNNIDLMIANGYTFSKSVEILTVLWEEYKKRSQVKVAPSTWQ